MYHFDAFTKEGKNSPDAKRRQPKFGTCRAKATIRKYLVPSNVSACWPKSIFTARESDSYNVFFHCSL